MSSRTLHEGEKDQMESQYNQALRFLGQLLEYADDVNAILKDVALFYEADRAYVFKIARDRATLDNTYEWCKPGITPQIDVLQNVPYESVAVWIEEFERSGAFHISSLDQDVESSSLTYQLLEPQGIDSLVTAPIYMNEKIIGFIGVDNPRQHANDVAILKTTAGVIYSGIRRKIAKQSETIQKMKELHVRKNEELSEIRDIVASANMGIWRIELVEGEEPRMYADETMKGLLGIQGKERTPEETYADWFSRIQPEAVPSVNASVDRMMQGFFDENTYLWVHPAKGARYVRCGGTARAIDGGHLLQTWMRSFAKTKTECASSNRR